MPKPNKIPWIRNFSRSSPVFKQLDFLNCFDQAETWPSLESLQEKLRQINPGLTSKFGSEIRFVPQGRRPRRFEDEYEVRIYQRGEVQTREKNWHDFFNSMIWLNLPQLKVTVNSLHYHAMLIRAQHGLKNRGHLENQLTHFDECGAVVLSTEESLLRLLQDKNWTELFYENREAWGKEICCVVFGHALYEKFLFPYEGLCAHALLCRVDTPMKMSRQELDHMLAFRFKRALKSGLYALPLLGVPGWYEGQMPSFYDNKSYFRPKNNI